MERAERLERLKDIEWAFKRIQKWAVRPSRYRKIHRTSILEVISVVSSQVKSLIRDASEEQVKDELES